MAIYSSSPYDIFSIADQVRKTAYFIDWPSRAINVLAVPGIADEIDSRLADISIQEEIDTKAARETLRAAEKKAHDARNDLVADISKRLATAPDSTTPKVGS